MRRYNTPASNTTLISLLVIAGLIVVVVALSVGIDWILPVHPD